MSGFLSYVAASGKGSTQDLLYGHLLQTEEEKRKSKEALRRIVGFNDQKSPPVPKMKKQAAKPVFGAATGAITGLSGQMPATPKKREHEFAPPPREHEFAPGASAAPAAPPTQGPAAPDDILAMLGMGAGNGIQAPAPQDALQSIIESLGMFNGGPAPTGGAAVGATAGMMPIGDMLMSPTPYPAAQPPATPPMPGAMLGAMAGSAAPPPAQPQADQQFVPSMLDAVSVLAKIPRGQSSDDAHDAITYWAGERGVPMPQKGTQAYDQLYYTFQRMLDVEGTLYGRGYGGGGYTDPQKLGVDYARNPQIADIRATTLKTGFTDTLTNFGQRPKVTGSEGYEGLEAQLDGQLHPGGGRAPDQDLKQLYEMQTIAPTTTGRMLRGGVASPVAAGLEVLSSATPFGDPEVLEYKEANKNELMETLRRMGLSANFYGPISAALGTGKINTAMLPMLGNMIAQGFEEAISQKTVEQGFKSGLGTAISAAGFPVNEKGEIDVSRFGIADWAEFITGFLAGGGSAVQQRRMRETGASPTSASIKDFNPILFPGAAVSNARDRFSRKPKTPVEPPVEQIVNTEPYSGRGMQTGVPIGARPAPEATPAATPDPAAILFDTPADSQPVPTGVKPVWTPEPEAPAPTPVVEEAPVVAPEMSVEEALNLPVTPEPIPPTTEPIVDPILGEISPEQFETPAPVAPVVEEAAAPVVLSPEQMGLPANFTAGQREDGTWAGMRILEGSEEGLTVEWVSDDADGAYETEVIPWKNVPATLAPDAVVDKSLFTRVLKAGKKGWNVFGPGLGMDVFGLKSVAQFGSAIYRAANEVVQIILERKGKRIRVENMKAAVRNEFRKRIGDGWTGLDEAKLTFITEEIEKALSAVARRDQEALKQNVEKLGLDKDETAYADKVIEDAGGDASIPDVEPVMPTQAGTRRLPRKLFNRSRDRGTDAENAHKTLDAGIASLVFNATVDPSAEGVLPVSKSYNSSAAQLIKIAEARAADIAALDAESTPPDQYANRVKYAKGKAMEASRAAKYQLTLIRGFRETLRGLAKKSDTPTKDRLYKETERALKYYEDTFNGIIARAEAVEAGGFEMQKSAIGRAGDFDAAQDASNLRLMKDPEPLRQIVVSIDRAKKTLKNLLTVEVDSSDRVPDRLVGRDNDQVDPDAIVKVEDFRDEISGSMTLEMLFDPEEITLRGEDFSKNRALRDLTDNPTLQRLLEDNPEFREMPVLEGLDALQQRFLGSLSKEMRASVLAIGETKANAIDGNYGKVASAIRALRMVFGKEKYDPANVSPDVAKAWGMQGTIGETAIANAGNFIEDSGTASRVANNLIDQIAQGIREVASSYAVPGEGKGLEAFIGKSLVDVRRALEGAGQGGVDQSGKAFAMIAQKLGNAFPEFPSAGWGNFRKALSKVRKASDGLFEPYNDLADEFKKNGIAWDKKNRVLEPRDMVEMEADDLSPAALQGLMEKVEAYEAARAMADESIVNLNEAIDLLADSPAPGGFAMQNADPKTRWANNQADPDAGEGWTGGVPEGVEVAPGLAVGANNTGVRQVDTIGGLESKIAEAQSVIEADAPMVKLIQKWIPEDGKPKMANLANALKSVMETRDGLKTWLQSAQSKELGPLDPRTMTDVQRKAFNRYEKARDLADNLEDIFSLLDETDGPVTRDAAMEALAPDYLPARSELADLQGRLAQARLGNNVQIGPDGYPVRRPVKLKGQPDITETPATGKVQKDTDGGATTVMVGGGAQSAGDQTTGYTFGLDQTGVNRNKNAFTITADQAQVRAFVEETLKTLAESFPPEVRNRLLNTTSAGETVAASALGEKVVNQVSDAVVKIVDGFALKSGVEVTGVSKVDLAKISETIASVLAGNFSPKSIARAVDGISAVTRGWSELGDDKRQAVASALIRGLLGDGKDLAVTPFVGVNEKTPAWAGRTRADIQGRRDRGEQTEVERTYTADGTDLVEVDSPLPALPGDTTGGKLEVAGAKFSLDGVDDSHGFTFSYQDLLEKSRILSSKPGSLSAGDVRAIAMRTAYLRAVAEGGTNGHRDFMLAMREIGPVLADYGMGETVHAKTNLVPAKSKTSSSVPDGTTLVDGVVPPLVPDKNLAEPEYKGKFLENSAATKAMVIAMGLTLTGMASAGNDDESNASALGTLAVMSGFGAAAVITAMLRSTKGNQPLRTKVIQAAEKLRLASRTPAGNLAKKSMLAIAGGGITAGAVAELFPRNDKADPEAEALKAREWLAAAGVLGTAAASLAVRKMYPKGLPTKSADIRNAHTDDVSIGMANEVQERGLSGKTWSTMSLHRVLRDVWQNSELGAGFNDFVQQQKHKGDILKDTAIADLRKVIAKHKIVPRGIVDEAAFDISEAGTPKRGGYAPQFPDRAAAIAHYAATLTTDQMAAAVELSDVHDTLAERLRSDVNGEVGFVMRAGGEASEVKYLPGYVHHVKPSGEVLDVFGDASYTQTVDGSRAPIDGELVAKPEKRRRGGTEVDRSIINSFEKYAEAMGHKYAMTHPAQVLVKVRQHMNDKGFRKLYEERFGTGFGVENTPIGSGGQRDLVKLGKTLDDYIALMTGDPMPSDATDIAKVAAGIHKVIGSTISRSALWGNMRALVGQSLTLANGVRESGELGLLNGVRLMMSKSLRDKLNSEVPALRVHMRDKPLGSRTLLQRGDASLLGFDGYRALEHAIASAVAANEYTTVKKQGASEEVAIRAASQAVQRITADRSATGSTLMQLKSAKLATQFWTDAMNSVQNFMDDTKWSGQRPANKAEQAVFLAQMVVYTYAANEMLRRVTGRGMSIDPVGAIMDVRDETWPTDNWITSIGRGVGAMVKQVGEINPAKGNLLGTTAEEIQSGFEAGVGPFSKESFQRGAAAAASMLIPGGRQIRKTTEGVKATMAGGKTSNSGRTGVYPVGQHGYWDDMKGLLFGPSAGQDAQRKAFERKAKRVKRR